MFRIRKCLFAACAIVALAAPAKADSFCQRYTGHECFAREAGVIDLYLRAEEVPQVMRSKERELADGRLYDDLRAFVHHGGTYEALMHWDVPIARWPLITAIADGDTEGPRIGGAVAESLR